MLDDSPYFKLIELDETVSTNTFLQGYRPAQLTDITLVTTEYQTAGRGQRGNSWESERGKNLLFSILVQPTFIPPQQLFILSEAIALSIHSAIVQVLGNNASDVTVKWPNDIYVGDCKIAGILIENDLQGSKISRAIIGCGVDINQASFQEPLPGHPTPVSLFQLTGQTAERSLILGEIVENFKRHYAALQGHFATAVEALHQRYVATLYRREGFHSFHDENGDFKAEIADVETTGHLVLRDEQGALRRYAFKEVSYL